MNEEWAQTAEKMKLVKQEVYDKCFSDSDFRNDLLLEPHKTLEEFYELEAGTLDTLKFDFPVEDERMVIPIPPDLGEMELSDEQLDQVAGGAAFIGIVAVGTIKVAGGVFLIGCQINASNSSSRRW
jgi:hypothetical protein